MQIFTIERNVPVPLIAGRGLPTPYPVANLSPGDSFFVPVGAIKGKDGEPRPAKEIRSRISSVTLSVARRHPGRKFTIRTITEDGVETGVRCWRLE